MKLVLRQGKELKAPEEKTVFEEDLSPEEKARILKEKRLGRLVQRDGHFGPRGCQGTGRKASC